MLGIWDRIINNSLFFIFCHLFLLDMRDLGWITSKLFGICTIYEANSKSVTIQAPKKYLTVFIFSNREVFWYNLRLSYFSKNVLYWGILLYRLPALLSEGFQILYPFWTYEVLGMQCCLFVQLSFAMPSSDNCPSPKLPKWSLYLLDLPE